MPANRNKRSVPSSLGDKAKTFVQWGLLSMEAVRLKCNSLILIFGGLVTNKYLFENTVFYIWHSERKLNFYNLSNNVTASSMLYECKF